MTLLMTPTDKKHCGNDAGLLLLLPTKLDGMGIPVFFSEITKMKYRNSSLLTEVHVLSIARQKRTYRIKKENVNNITKKIK